MAVYPAWATGDTLSASSLRDAQSQIIDTSTTQSVAANSITSGFDNELFFYGQANASYLVEARLLFNMTTTDVAADIIWSTPTGVTKSIQSFGSTQNNANMVSRTQTRVAVQATSSFVLHSMNNDGLDMLVWQDVTFQLGNVPGYIRLEWVAQTSVTGTVTRDVGSVIFVTRFA